MIIRQFRAGELMFEEGAHSEFACRLVSGEADVIKHHGGDAVILGTVRAGEFIGEMGVIEGVPRWASVRAVTAVTAETYPADEFLQRISTEPELALQLMVRLSERLKTVGRAFVEAVAIAAADPTPESAADLAPPTLLPIRLMPDSDQVAAMMPPDGIQIETFPFVIGRVPDAGEATPRTAPDLSLQDHRPYRLSRTHFAIDMGRDGYWVRDLASTLGTEVNGRTLGAMFASDELPLDPGETVISAGGRDSPFRFRVVT